MASSNGSSNNGNVPQEPAGSADKAVSDDPYEETKEDAETIVKSGELMTKLETNFSTLMNALMVKFGQQIYGIMKPSLECSICKELIIEAVFRKCEHTFCYHCLIYWTRNSHNCPMCRDEGRLVFKNSLMDGLIQLLVDLTFSEDEKMERINSIQQRTTSPATVDDEQTTIVVAALPLIRIGICASTRLGNFYLK